MGGSWVPGSTWPAEVLPWGVVVLGGRRRPAVAVGDHVLDLAGLADTGLLAGALDHPAAVLHRSTLDGLMDAGPDAWRRLRARLRELVHDPAAERRAARHLHPLAATTSVLAWTVADVAALYCSRAHALAAAAILRPGDASLPPAYDHVPLGYHARAGTVQVGGEPVVRPAGLRPDPDGSGRLTHGPTAQLDVEVELGTVVGHGSPHGRPLTVAEAEDHAIGVVLVADWSARDVQAVEQRPLGPFLGKSFATSVSPWIVPTDVLAAHAQVPPTDPPRDPVAHLAVAEATVDDVAFALALTPTGADAEQVVSRPRGAQLGWSRGQQLAHLTSNGAPLRRGDLVASGTVSGPEPATAGCLLELTHGGRDPLALRDGTRRRWLEDGDAVTIRGAVPGPDGAPLPLGELRARVEPWEDRPAPAPPDGAR